MDLPDSPSLLVLMLRVNKAKQSETVMGLMFCILLLVSLVKSGVYEVGICGVAGDVSSGEVAGGLLLVLVCKHMKTNTVKMPMLQLSTP